MKYYGQGISMKMFHDKSINILEILRPMMKAKGLDIDTANEIKSIFYIVGDDEEGNPYLINADKESANWVELLFLWDDESELNDYINSESFIEELLPHRRERDQL